MDSKALGILFLLALFIFLGAIRRKGVIDEKALGDPVRYFKLGNDYICAKCGLQMSSFAPPLRNQSRSFKRHLTTHAWLGFQPTGNDEIRIEIDDDDLGGELLREPDSEENRIFQEKLDAFQNLTPQQKFFMQCYIHRKSHPNNSNGYFDGFFRKLDWSLNYEPIQKISWRRVQYLADKHLPFSDLNTLEISGHKYLYLSPLAICRRWYFSPKSAHLRNWRARSPDSNLHDIYDGSAWNEFIASGFLDERRNLIFLLGADGFSKFRSRSSSISGIYMVPMNLPARERAHRKNWSTICCFSNDHLSDEDLESTLHLILVEIVKDFLTLETGITLYDALQKGDFFFRARIGLVIGDLIEMAELLEKAHPTGIRSCHVCSNPSNEWAFFHLGNNMKYRTHDDTKEYARLASLMKNDPSIPQNKKDLFFQATGMKGQTPFFLLPYFSYMKHVGIDGMHNILLGWDKEVTIAILYPIISSAKKVNISKVAIFDQVMKETECPTGIVKISRSIKHLKDFTSSEWLTLMRLGYPALLKMDIGERETSLLEQTWHMSLQFLKPSFTRQELARKEGEYRMFANAIWNYFGWSRLTCTLNWHLPVHFVRLILLWGPLVYFWCWVIERMNQSCKTIIDHGNHKNVENFVMVEMTRQSDLYFVGGDLFSKDGEEGTDSEPESEDENESPEASKTCVCVRKPYPFDLDQNEVKVLRFLKTGKGKLNPAKAKSLGTFVEVQQGDQKYFGRVHEICQGRVATWLYVIVFQHKTKLSGSLGEFFDLFEAPDNPGKNLLLVDLKADHIRPVTVSKVSDRTVMVNGLLDAHPRLSGQ